MCAESLHAAGSVWWGKGGGCRASFTKVWKNWRVSTGCDLAGCPWNCVCMLHERSRTTLSSLWPDSTSKWCHCCNRYKTGRCCNSYKTGHCCDSYKQAIAVTDTKAGHCCDRYKTGYCWQIQKQAVAMTVVVTDTKAGRCYECCCDRYKSSHCYESCCNRYKSRPLLWQLQKQAVAVTDIKKTGRCCDRYKSRPLLWQIQNRPLL